MSAVLPFLVAVPLLAAAVGVVLPGRVVRPLSVVVPLLTAAAGVWLLVEHRTGDPVVVQQVGGFVPGVAIPMVSDTLAAVMITVTGFTSAVVLAFAWLSGEARLRFLPSLALMLVAGVNGALLTGDLFNLFVFIEVMLLPSYALIAMTGTWRRLGIGRLFVVVNLVTSTILLIGVGLVYGVAGSVNMAVLAGADHDDPRYRLAVATVLLALSVKAGLVPFHSWLPRAYPATSAPVMALFSALHTKVAIYALFRVVSVVLGGFSDWVWLALALVLVTMLVGGYGSLGERVVRRNLSWQMVAGVGYILLGLAIGTRLGLASGLFYMLHHILVMGSLLLGAAAIEHVYRSGEFTRLSGLMRREPFLAIVMALAMLSLVGFPPSSGFFAKVGVVRAAAGLDDPQRAIVMGVVIVASVGSLLSMVRLWRHTFWGPPLEEMPSAGKEDHPCASEVEPGTRAPQRFVVPAAVLLAASLVLFVAPGLVFSITEQAADGLLDLSAYVEAVTAP
ncbi:monovalent cation/H+ antiporter subunit D family protein [Nocardioides bruguierae]|uniref:Monovalent cation/H+ antiporter subunit D family protein n=1 Tax=Nocardioides bruguierae TaxID=2945102 RepID=A0A9X2D7A6_9ACTN|nr:monovalent cation/H+ antiporter subunit D family protein [Nocardioides bruguierae]MCL8027443.1 monovalent cation/H+ antiporter subunit D family protein [Nocardioides bruguierae]MCM0620713.1 monovalent cation/H+ antiporter subunit D family protein [Nocardioides bruguierae]